MQPEKPVSRDVEIRLSSSAPHLREQIVANAQHAAKRRHDPDPDGRNLRPRDDRRTFDDLHSHTVIVRPSTAKARATRAGASVRVCHMNAAWDKGDPSLWGARLRPASVVG